MNAKLQTRSVAAGLEKEFRGLVGAQTDPAWIGYAVPAIDGQHNMCCCTSCGGRDDHCCGRCSLEGRKGSSSQSSGAATVALESRTLFVLFRVEQRRVDRIRTFSPDCELDAGGLPFFWLRDVRPAESVMLLSSFATAPEAEKKESGRAGEAALAAIALHADPAADRALEQFVASSQPEWLRGRTAFWLGVSRGRRGYELLRRMAREDPSERVRDKVVFALSQSKEAEAVDEMIRVARSDASSHVRGQTLFWLAQKAGNKAGEAITEAIEKDPETEVKKRAVFALSQLPKDEGVPLLIGVARSNRNPAVRKQAIFWLGQSRDPRALAFFEQVLVGKK